MKQVLFPGSAEYWEQRYASGGTSGQGSYGKLAEFKADVINRLVRERGVTSVIEFGCGDGNQLRLADYPGYVGLDVSGQAVNLCAEKFRDDASKKFFLYDPSRFDDKAEEYQADLALSLDVIYHLVEDEVYHTYLKHLFGAARKYVIVYASDKDRRGGFYERHVRHRNFTKDIAERFPDWTLSRKIKNKYPEGEGSGETSFADFFIYEAR
ncbi:hypothetical protein UZ36_01370 [Candidatus Nitromaritima sp. SCGC AAA799-C22]|nr:hypothetical protein UZ36_01370 [Candidatus Nitromaritima sp. SCGC AAA799-C22]